MRSFGFAFALASLFVASSAFAEEGAPQKDKAEREESEEPTETYVTAAATATLMSREGRDLSPTFGVGHAWTESVMIEFDLAPVFKAKGYESFFVVPGVVWELNAHVYTAMRAMVKVHPEAEITLAPGLGAIQKFKGGFQPFVEVNPLAMNLVTAPSFGFGATVGANYAF